MKIVHVIPNLMKGGAERLCIDICNELASREENEVKLVVFTPDNLYPELTQNIDIIHCPVTFNLSITKSNEIDISSYTDFINSFHPDVIHSHLYKAEIITRETTNSNTRYITHLHDNMPQLLKGGISTFFKKEKITNYYERRRLLKKYKVCNNQFISISKDTSLYFSTNLPVQLQNITLIQNAIDIDKFTRPDTWVNKNENTLKLVTIGSLVDKKNQIFLLEVVKQLIEKGFNPQLSILGDGPNRPLIEKAIEESKLEKHIKLKGNVNNVEEYLWSSDIYVHAATYEPFGLVLLEAMAAGLPCVSINGGGNQDVISNEENGFIIEKGNVDLYIDSIIRLRTDDDLRQKIINNATNFVQDYGIKEYVDKLVNIYTVNRRS